MIAFLISISSAFRSAFQAPVLLLRSHFLEARSVHGFTMFMFTAASDSRPLILRGDSRWTELGILNSGESSSMRERRCGRGGKGGGANGEILKNGWLVNIVSCQLQFRLQAAQKSSQSW